MYFKKILQQHLHVATKIFQQMIQWAVQEPPEQLISVGTFKQVESEDSLQRVDQIELLQDNQ